MLKYAGNSDIHDETVTIKNLTKRIGNDIITM